VIRKSMTGGASRRYRIRSTESSSRFGHSSRFANARMRPFGRRFFDHRAAEPAQVVFVEEADGELPLDCPFGLEPVVRDLGELGQTMLCLGGRQDAETHTVALGATKELPIQLSCSTVERDAVERRMCASSPSLKKS